MGKVAADADLLRISVMGRTGGVGSHVVESNSLVNVVDDRLHARPAQGRLAEQLPGDGREPVGVAVAAAHEEDEDIVGQILHSGLGSEGDDRIG